MMSSTLILVQFACQNIALFCCALFAGAATYVSLAEHPTIIERGTAFGGDYFLAAHPRNTIIQSAFAVTGAVAGVVAGVAGGSLWWLCGGLLLAVAALLLLVVVLPATSKFLHIDAEVDAPVANRLFRRILHLQAALSLVSLGALFMFIFKL